MKFHQLNVFGCIFVADQPAHISFDSQFNYVNRTANEATIVLEFLLNNLGHVTVERIDESSRDSLVLKMSRDLKVQSIRIRRGRAISLHDRLPGSDRLVMQLLGKPAALSFSFHKYREENVFNLCWRSYTPAKHFSGPTVGDVRRKMINGTFLNSAEYQLSIGNPDLVQLAAQMRRGRR